MGLGTLYFGAGMIDVFHRQVQFIFMAIGTPTILRPPIGQNPAEWYFVGIKERDPLVIEEIGSGERGLAVIELGKAHLGVGIDEGLLIDPADALSRPDVECILRPTIAWTCTLKLAVGFFLDLGLLQGGQLRLRQDMALLGDLGF